MNSDVAIFDTIVRTSVSSDREGAMPVFAYVKCIEVNYLFIGSAFPATIHPDDKTDHTFFVFVVC